MIFLNIFLSVFLFIHFLLFCFIYYLTFYFIYLYFVLFSFGAPCPCIPPWAAPPPYINVTVGFVLVTSRLVSLLRGEFSFFSVSVGVFILSLFLCFSNLYIHLSCFLYRGWGDGADCVLFLFLSTGQE